MLRKFWRNPKTRKAIAWGIVSGILYYLLFHNAHEVLVWSVKSWWSPLVPISIAFAISYAHGNFTGAFWEALGVKPKSTIVKK